MLFAPEISTRQGVLDNSVPRTADSVPYRACEKRRRSHGILNLARASIRVTDVQYKVLCTRGIIAGFALKPWLYKQDRCVVFHLRSNAGFWRVASRRKDSQGSHFAITKKNIRSFCWKSRSTSTTRRRQVNCSPQKHTCHITTTMEWLKLVCQKSYQRILCNML